MFPWAQHELLQAFPLPTHRYMQYYSFLLIPRRQFKALLVIKSCLHLVDVLNSFTLSFLYGGREIRDVRKVPELFFFLQKPSGHQ